MRRRLSQLKLHQDLEGGKHMEKLNKNAQCRVDLFELDPQVTSNLTRAVSSPRLKLAAEQTLPEIKCNHEVDST